MFILNLLFLFFGTFIILGVSYIHYISGSIGRKMAFSVKPDCYDNYAIYFLLAPIVILDLLNLDLCY